MQIYISLKNKLYSGKNKDICYIMSHGQVVAFRVLDLTKKVDRNQSFSETLFIETSSGIT